MCRTLKTIISGAVLAVSALSASPVMANADIEFTVNARNFFSDDMCEHSRYVEELASIVQLCTTFQVHYNPSQDYGVTYRLGHIPLGSDDWTEDSATFIDILSFVPGEQILTSVYQLDPAAAQYGIWACDADACTPVNLNRINCAQTSGCAEQFNLVFNTTNQPSSCF